MDKNNANNSSLFEAVCQINEYSAEYWCARDIQKLLGYSRWQSFERVKSPMPRAREAFVATKGLSRFV